MVVAKYDWSCLSHCLMGNHYHLLIEISESNLSEGMQELNGKYAREFNDRTGRDGCVFGSRFWSKQVTTDRYLHAAVRYINLNPVEARICREADETRLEFHRELAGEARSQRVASTSRTLALLGAGAASRNPYVELVGSPCPDPLTAFVIRLDALRRASGRWRSAAHGGWASRHSRSPRRSTAAGGQWRAGSPCPATKGSDPFVAGDIRVRPLCR